MLDIGLILTCLSVLDPAAERHFDPGVVTLRDGDTPAQIERTRIQRHLANVESTLRGRSAANLDQAQRAARAQALDALHEYWQAGRFPRNADFVDRRVPYFIDDEGTACAVGHLMIESGAAELAREIATYENNDFVADIDHPGVAGWLEHNGFTAAEAAWIQPAYGPCGFGGEALVCGADGNTYLCEYIAVECAGVEVAHEGACGEGTSSGSADTGTSDSSGSGTGSSSGEDATTGGGMVIGEEICPVGTSSEGGSESSGGSSSGSGGNTSTASTSSTQESTGPEPAGDDDDDKGCSCDAGGRPGGAIGSLVLFAWLGLRRRRSHG
jgi:hypothetical protein